MAMNMDAALRIKAKVDGVNNIVSLNRSIAAIEGTAKGATGAMRGLTGAAAGLSGALGALAPLASIAGLVGLAKNSLDAGNKMFDLAQKTGVSVEALARFNKAARVSGTDIDAVGKALVKLSRGMVEAAATGKGKAADSLKALGINAVDASGKLKSADRVTLEIANRFKSMADGPAKAALAMNLFGKAGADMIPLLNMGGDSIDKLSVKMTTAFAEKADQYSDKLAMLSGKVGAFGADLLIALLPALNAVTDAVSAAVSGFNAMPALLKNVAVGGALVAVAFGPLAGLVKATTGAFVLGQAAIQGFQLQMRLAAMQGIPLLNAAIMSIPLVGWAIAAVAAIAALGAALYLNNKGFKDWADTSVNYIKVMASDGMGTMQSFGQWLGKAWNGLAKGAQKIGSAIGQAFSGPFGMIANVAKSVFDFVGQKIQGLWNMLPEGVRKSIGGVGSYFQGAWNKAAGMTAAGGGKSGGGGGGGGGGGDFTPDMTALAGSGAGSAAKAKAKDKSLAAEIADALKGALSINDAQAAGIVGNFMRESALNPRVNEGGAVGMPRGVGGYGLAQWTGSRQQDLIRFAGGAGQAGDLQTQLRFVVKELLGPENRALQSLRSAQSPEQAAVIFDRDYERSGVKALGQRKANARRVYGEIAGTGSGAGLGDFAKGLEAEQKETEQTAKQLTAARDLLAVRQAAFAVTSAASPLEKLSAEFDQQRADRMRDYAGKLQNARSDEERILIAQSQTVDIRGSEIAFQEQRKTLIADQLKLEQEKAKVVTELATRNSIGAGVRQGLDGYVEQVGTLRDAVGQLTTNSIGGLENSLVSLATTGKANFQEFAASVLKDVTQMIIRQLILRTIMQAIGFISGGAGGAGGAVTGDFMNTTALSGLTPAASGATFANGIAKFASGGIVNRPTLFKFASGGAMQTGVMGEAGPEAIMPLKRGADGKLGVAGGGGSTNVVVNVDASGNSQVSGNAGQGEQLGRVISQAVQQELIKQKRPGGILAG